MGCANAKRLSGIIQSIPSPKAEPFKLWLAQVGSDRLDEIENPELAAQRTSELYKLKGYTDNWIEKRMRSITIKRGVTDNWKPRGFVMHNPGIMELSKEKNDIVFRMPALTFEPFFLSYIILPQKFCS